MMRNCGTLIGRLEYGEAGNLAREVKTGPRGVTV